MTGTNGADTLTGTFGDDTLEGQAGADVLNGAAGDDLIDGGAGSDSMAGRAGHDIFVVSGGPDIDRILDIEFGEWVRIPAGNPDLEMELVVYSGDGRQLKQGQLSLGSPSDGMTKVFVGLDTIPGADLTFELAGSYSAHDFVIGYDLTGDPMLQYVPGGVAIDATDDPEALYGSQYADSLRGFGGDDILVGYEGDDVLAGGDGDDTLVSHTGNDTLDGWTGTDTAVYEIPGLFPTYGVQVDLSAGQGYKAGLGIDLLRNIENVVGSHGSDTIVGTTGSNHLEGGNGFDLVVAQPLTLFYRAGSDYVSQAGSADLLEGGTGGDTLQGGPGNDTLYGGSADGTPDTWLNYFAFAARGNGVDFIADYAALDRFTIGAVLADSYASVGDGTTVSGRSVQGLHKDGQTLLFIDTDGVAGAEIEIHIAGTFFITSFDASASGDQSVISYLGPAATERGDFLQFPIEAGLMHGLGGNDRIVGNIGDDTLLGDDGDDDISGGAGNDSLDGGAGTDWANYNVPGVTSGVNVNLSTGMASQDGFGGHDALSGFEKIRGTALNDTLIGNAADNQFFPSGGSDSIDGGPGFDTVYFDVSSPGLELDLRAGTGSIRSLAQSTLHFASIEAVWAGEGDDHVQLPDSGGTVDGGNGNDFLSGGNGNDRLTGYGGNDTVLGGDGDDWLGGGAGTDSVDGGAGNDTVTFNDFEAVPGLPPTGAYVHLAWGVATDSGRHFERIGGFENVEGSGQADTLIGDAGANKLSSFASYDRLDGGAGDDTLDGGQQDDTLTGGAGNDVFLLNAADGGVDLLTDFGPGDVLRIQAAVPIGGPPHLLQAAQDGLTTVLTFDLDGAAGSDATIRLTGAFDAGLFTLSQPLAGVVELRTTASAAPPLSGVELSGSGTQGSSLSATASVLPGAAGVLVWRWFQDGLPIAGATGTTFALTEAQVGHSITVEAAYMENGRALAQLSQSTLPIGNVNDAPSGGVQALGRPVAGRTLIASSGLQDADGLGVLQWQWTADGHDIAGATGMTYTLAAADAGSSIAVRASYVDGHGTSESVTSSATAPIQAGTDDLWGMAYDWKGHQLLAGVNVSLGASGQLATAADGAFAFDGLGTTWALAASRDASDAGTAINSADALAALRIAVGVNPNASSLKLSPYQLIAADANGDGMVNSADALAILRMAVKAPGAPAPTWQFVREDLDLWNEATQTPTVTRADTTWPTAITGMFATDRPVNLVGVLRGDVDGSWSAAGATDLDTTEPAYFQALGYQLGLPTDVWGF